MNKIKDKILVLLISIFLLLDEKIALAGTGPLDDYTKMTTQTRAFSGGAGFNVQTRIGDIVSTTIQAFLGLLGVIFVILIISAGYNWMTSAGEEEKVNKAKDTIKRAIIGIIIIIGAYAITYFVFRNIQSVDRPAI